MDVRETAELDEDERFITIADGSDTGIVNNQVPEADIIRYKDSTYEIVSKIAYLIGVPKRIFENEHEPPKTEVYERLEQDKAARIIRHLCIIRTAIERNFKHINEKMRFDYTSIYNLPEYIPPDSMTQLSADGVNFVRKSSKKLCHHVIEINKLIAGRINNCKKLFPLWLNWQYVKNLFVMPNGLTEDGTKAAADIYYSHLLFYPYQVYINWTPKEEGNILYNDKKFVTLLYQWNNDYFTEYSKVSDAGSYVSLPRLCFDFSSNVQSIGFIDHIFQRQHDTAMKISGIRCIKLIRNSNEANIMSMEILFDIITCVNRISP